MSNKNLLIAAVSGFTAVSIASTASAAIAEFDIEEDASNTQAGYASVFGSGTDNGVTLTLGGIASGDYRARGINATGVQGGDNDDNPVPEGVFSDLYREVAFGRGATVTLDFSGLAASTDYLITVVSYDSAQNGVISADWSSGASSENITFDGDLIGAGNDPDTDTLDTYTATLAVTSDINGDVTVTGTSVAGLIFVNGAIVSEVPEPSSLALIGLGGLAMLRRRRG